MQNSDFEGPPLSWSLISIVGGIATAAFLIIGLEFGAEGLAPMRAEFLEKTTQVRPPLAD